MTHIITRTSKEMSQAHGQVYLCRHTPQSLNTMVRSIIEEKRERELSNYGYNYSRLSDPYNREYLQKTNHEVIESATSVLQKLLPDYSLSERYTLLGRSHTNVFPSIKHKLSRIDLGLPDAAQLDHLIKQKQDTRVDYYKYRNILQSYVLDLHYEEYAGFINSKYYNSQHVPQKHPNPGVIGPGRGSCHGREATSTYTGYFIGNITHLYGPDLIKTHNSLPNLIADIIPHNFEESTPQLEIIMQTSKTGSFRLTISRCEHRSPITLYQCPILIHGSANPAAQSTLEISPESSSSESSSPKSPLKDSPSSAQDKEKYFLITGPLVSPAQLLRKYCLISSEENISRREQNEEMDIRTYITQKEGKFKIDYNTFYQKSQSYFSNTQSINEYNSFAELETAAKDKFAKALSSSDPQYIIGGKGYEIKKPYINDREYNVGVEFNPFQIYFKEVPSERKEFEMRINELRADPYYITRKKRQKEII